MLNKIKIGPKLIGGFIIVACIGVLIGIIGLTNINLIGKNKLPAVQALIEMGKQQNAVQYAIRGAMLPRYWEDLKLITNQFTAYDEAMKKINGLIDEYENIPKGKLEASEFERLHRTITEWEKTSDAIINNAKQKFKFVEAGTPMNDPKIVKLEDELYSNLAPVARSAYLETCTSMDKLIAMNNKGANDAIKFSGIVMPCAIAVGVILAVLLGLFLTFSITHPMTQCVEMIKNLSKGKFNEKLEMTRKDELGTLAESMDQLVDIITLMNKDVQMLADAGVEGRMHTRADISKHEGGFRDIVNGINRTLDAVLGYLDSIPQPAMIIDPEFNIRYMNKAGASLGGKDQKQLVGTKCYDFFKTGDCRTERCACGKAMMSGQPATNDTDAHPGGHNLDITYTGVPFKNDKNQIVGVFEVVSDMTAVKKAQRLATKISDFQNNEVAKVTDCLGKLSKGNLKFTIEVAEADADTRDTREVFVTIANGLTESKAAIERLANDANMLAQAGINGDLQKRADVGNHQGDFRKVIQGINDCLDAVIGPLNVSAKYVDDISKGIIPPKITDKYNGDFNAIKENLNQCIDALSSLIIDDGGVVLEAAAGKDLSRRLTKDYTGEFARMKDNINKVIVNLDTALSQVSEATEQVSSASQQISAGSQSLAQGANEQASSLEEVSSSLEEMSSMTKQNAENANQAKNLAGEANHNAASGIDAMKRMNTSIIKIKESSDQTAKIVKTIDEIAMQTNLLALNAAVEAARAGEAGRGFAVVAEEVRNLAGRSAEAAKNTANLIEESVKNAEEGVTISSEVGKSFDVITGSVKKVNDLIAEIAAASQEQSQGIDQINSAVAQMDKVTQQNAANSEETASAAEEMSSQAEELQSMIGQFILSHSSTYRYSSAPASLSAVSPHHHSEPPKKNSTIRVKAPRSSSPKKVHSDELIPLDDEVLKEF